MLAALSDCAPQVRARLRPGENESEGEGAQEARTQGSEGGTGGAYYPRERESS